MSRCFYRREQANGDISYQGSMFPVEDPELTEITEEEFNEAVIALTPVEPEPTDEATEEDFLAALGELGVIS